MGFDTIPTGLATGVAGSMFAKEVVQAIGAGARFIMPAGFFYVYAVGANTKLQVQDSTGTWQDVRAVALGDMIASDGVNVGYVNGGGGSQNITYIKCG